MLKYLIVVLVLVLIMYVVCRYEKFDDNIRYHWQTSHYWRCPRDYKHTIDQECVKYEYTFDKKDVNKVVPRGFKIKKAEPCITSLIGCGYCENI